MVEVDSAHCANVRPDKSRKEKGRAYRRSSSKTAKYHRPLVKQQILCCITEQTESRQAFLCLSKLGMKSAPAFVATSVQSARKTNMGLDWIGGVHKHSTNTL